MSVLLVLTGVDVEAHGLARRLGLARVAVRDVLHFRRPGLDVVCVGPRAARLDAVGDGWPPDTVVVSAGTAGALDPALREGDLLVPAAVVTPAGARHPLEPVGDLPCAGHLLCVDAVVSTRAAKARLWARTGAAAVDMESAVIVAWARHRGLRPAVVRAISDAAHTGVPPSLAAAVDDHGRTRPGRALRAVLAHPATFSRTLALRRGTSLALATVATTLSRVARSDPW